LKVINQFKVNLNLVAALEEFKDEIREGKYEEITKADNVLNGRIQSVLANLKKNNSKEEQYDEPEIEN